MDKIIAVDDGDPVTAGGVQCQIACACRSEIAGTFDQPDPGVMRHRAADDRHAVIARGVIGNHDLQPVVGLRQDRVYCCIQPSCAAIVLHDDRNQIIVGTERVGRRVQ